jgi:hypothetical protein
LDQRLCHLLTDEQRRGPERGIDHDTKNSSSEKAERKGGDEGKADSRCAEEVGEIQPGAPGGWMPQPVEGGFLEPIGPAGVSHDHSQKRRCEEADNPDDRELGAWHGKQTMSHRICELPPFPP